jgi:hypothetical protein
MKKVIQMLVFGREFLLHISSDIVVLIIDVEPVYRLD